MRAAFLFIASVHIVGLVTLLTMQGCHQPPETPVETPATPAFEPTNTPAADTNMTSMAVVSNTAPVENYMPPAPVASTSEYVIVKGDSFYTIGKAHGVSLKAIQAANPGVDSTKLKIGQKIILPAPSAPTTPTTTAMTTTGDETIYTVVSGDTLTSIAKKHNVTIKEIRAANNLDTDRIKVGQKLKIPAKAPAAMVAPVTAPVTPTTTPVGR